MYICENMNWNWSLEQIQQYAKQHSRPMTEQERKARIAAQANVATVQDAASAAEDEVSISSEAKQLSKEEQQNQTQGNDLYAALENARNSAKQAQQMGDSLAMITEIVRRMARGDTVPMDDEQTLMNFDQKMYMAAKTAQIAAQSRKEGGENHDSLTEAYNEKYGGSQSSAPQTETADSAPASAVVEGINL